MSALVDPLNGMHLNADQVKQQIDDKATLLKRDGLSNGQLTNSNMSQQDKIQQHPLHQYDLTIMSKFYESCVNKLKETNKKFKPTEWIHAQPMPHHITYEQKNEWSNPLVISQKQHVYEAFAQLARETGEPMILMPNFDYGDILNFERFLQAMKQDGVNAIGKYKQYLNNKDMRKFEVDLVVVHAKYGVLLIEVKDCDHLDNKRRSRARIQLNNARSCFEAMGRLICEAKGWTNNEAHIQITEIIAVPNVKERPQVPQKQQQQTDLQTQGENQNQSATSNSSSSIKLREPRVLNYLIKSDLENTHEFGKWFQKHIAEPKQTHQKMLENENKQNKFDSTALNWMLGLVNCIRNNSIMPVVYPENDGVETTLMNVEEKKITEHETNKSDEENKDTTTTPKEEKQVFQPALKLHGEFFNKQHEAARSSPKCFVISKDSERIRKTICLQTLWLMLNDSQKKISVLCSEMNKAYYDEFFARQRKLYNNFHNIRFYTDLQSCTPNTQNTLKKDNEIWFFDSAINGSLSDVMDRIKDLNAYWVFTTQEEAKHQYDSLLKQVNVKVVELDNVQEQKEDPMSCTLGKSLKFPLRL